MAWLTSNSCRFHTLSFFCLYRPPPRFLSPSAESVAGIKLQSNNNLIALWSDLQLLENQQSRISEGPRAHSGLFVVGAQTRTVDMHNAHISQSDMRRGSLYMYGLHMCVQVGDTKQIRWINESMIIKIQLSLRVDPAKTSDWLLVNYRCLSDRWIPGD